MEFVKSIAETLLPQGEDGEHEIGEESGEGRQQVAEAEDEEAKEQLQTEVKETATATATPKKPKTPKSSKSKTPVKRKLAETEPAGEPDPELPPAKRTPGRPKGSVNKPKERVRKAKQGEVRRSTRETMEPERLETEQAQQTQEPVKRGRGRPRGSVSKKPAASGAASPKKRGRPAGSKNKAKAASAGTSAAAAGSPRKRGRPAGSKNKTATPKAAGKTGDATPKKRGRPPGSGTPKAAKTGGETPSGKRRGRPPGSKNKPT